MAKIFISYSQRDTAVANLLYAWVHESGADAWYDQLDMQPGRTIVDGIVDGISASDAVILILSRSFLASGWADYEGKTALTKAVARKLKLFILKLDDCSVPEYLQPFFYVDLRKGYYESGLERLRSELRKSAGTADAARERVHIHEVLKRRMSTFERKREPAFADHEYDDLQRLLPTLPLSQEEYGFVAVLAAYKGLDLGTTVARAQHDAASVSALLRFALDTAALRSHLRAGLILERLDRSLVESTWPVIRSGVKHRPDRIQFIENVVLEGSTTSHVIQMLESGQADQSKLVEVLRQAAEQLRDQVAIDYLSRPNTPSPPT